MRAKKAVKLLLPLVLLLVTVIFIWSNSAKDAAASTLQSDGVGEWMRRLFNVEKEPFRFLYENRRKVAHFAEFFLLGLESAAFFLLNLKNEKLAAPCALLLSCLVATVDEGIQYFVPGRVSAFADVCLDTCGALCAIAFVWLARRLFVSVAKK